MERIQIDEELLIPIRQKETHLAESHSGGSLPWFPVRDGMAPPPTVSPGTNQAHEEASFLP